MAQRERESQNILIFRWYDSICRNPQHSIRKWQVPIPFQKSGKIQNLYTKLQFFYLPIANILRKEILNIVYIFYQWLKILWRLLGNRKHLTFLTICACSIWTIMPISRQNLPSSARVTQLLPVYWNFIRLF